MNASPRRAEAARGQVLSLAVVALFCAALFIAYFARSTERLIQRERVRARADVTAFSGGVTYARGLNVLAASQKVVAAGWVFQVFDAGKTKNAVQKTQKAFMKFGPWMNVAVTANVAYENGLWALPVWNQDVLLEDFSPQDLLPSYNVAPYTLSNAASDAIKKAADWALGSSAEAAVAKRALDKELEEIGKKHGEKAKEEAARAIRRRLGARAPEGLLTTSHYEYKQGGNKVVRVEKEDAGPVWENKADGGKTLRYKAGKKHKYRYVSQVEGLNADYQLSLDEGQPHMLTLLAMQSASPDRRRQRPGTVLALSQVQVAGGGLSLVDPDGSAYGATLVPVRVYPESGWKQKGAWALLASAATGKDPAWKEDGGFQQRLSGNEALSLAQGLAAALPLPPEIAQKAQRGMDLARELQEIQH